MSRLVCVAPNPAIDRTYDVERLVPGTIHRPVRSTAVAGGKGLNAARAARQLGADVVAVTILRGHAGRWIEEALSAAGVPVRAAWGAGESRTCLSVRDPTTNELTEIYDSGPPMAPASWSALESLVSAEIDAGAELLTVSGSLPPGIDPQAFGHLCRAVDGRGARVVLDVYGEGLAAALPERPWLVKVNMDEAAGILGRALTGEDDARDAAADLVARGAVTAIVTRGRAGAVLVTIDGSWRVGPPPAEGRYAVGSGDAFLGGLAAGLLEDRTLVDAVRLASGAAAANALVPGQGDFDPHEARRLAELVAVDRL